MADALAASPPSPAAPSPFAADDLVDARLAPWPPFAPWPAPGQLHHDRRDGGHANPLFTILPASALAIGVVLLVAVAVILVMTRRSKPGTVDGTGGASCNGDKPGGAPASSCGSSVRGYNNSRYYAAAAAGKCAQQTNQCIITSIAKKSLTASNAGCIYGGRLGFSVQPRNRGAQVFTYRELESATDGFSECNVVGRGAYGVVFRGRLGDGTTAAIKRLKMDGRREGEREFRIEVDLLSRMHSPYLVGLLGYCADQSHRLLVFEFMPNGSLKSHLHRRAAAPAEQPPPLDWQTRLGIALDCARALEFLHEHSSPAVIHRDFKCSNILLDHNYRARVSDFGMAKLGSNKANGQVTTRVLGTTGYLAPEYAQTNFQSFFCLISTHRDVTMCLAKLCGYCCRYASTGKLTTKSDVYSYGVVLLELLTGRVPVDTKRPPGQHALPRLTNREKLVQMVDPALIGQFSLKDLVQVAAITAMCIQTKADYRPLMTDVVQSLIPIVKSPLMSCTSTPLRPAHGHHHVVYMSPSRGSSNGGALETRCIMHGLD
uniref:non-specific serine/threonine protein kinase n=1 Tax=Oryza punctata TaxID=4537 RepID=A0A0E0L284_ORYPU